MISNAAQCCYYEKEGEFIVDEILQHRQSKKGLQFLIKWNLGDTTWISKTEANSLEALDIYLDKYGVTDCSDLPKECIIQSTDSVNSDKDVQYDYECNELIDDNIYDSVQSNVETASEIDNYIDQFSTNTKPVDFGS